VKIEKKEHAELLPVGTVVKRYIQSDYVQDELGDFQKQIGTSEETKKRIHWTRHNYKIVNVLLNPDSPPRYILQRLGLYKKKPFEVEHDNPVHYKHVKRLSIFKS